MAENGERVIKVKKLFIGIIIGSVLSFAASANADVIGSVVGKMIEGEFPVKIGGKQLENKAIVVNGTSYLPVREFGEAIGYSVKFDASLGITMEKELGKEIPVTRRGEFEISIEDRTNDLARRIELEEAKLGIYDFSINERKKNGMAYDDIEKNKQDMINQIKSWKEQKARLETLMQNSKFDKLVEYRDTIYIKYKDGTEEVYQNLAEAQQ